MNVKPPPPWGTFLLVSHVCVRSIMCKQPLDICTKRTLVQTQTYCVLGPAHSWAFLFVFRQPIGSQLTETPHHGRQISAYLHYAQGEVHTSSTAMVFFSSVILGWGSSEEALFNGIKCSFEWKIECVCVCVRSGSLCAHR